MKLKRYFIVSHLLALLTPIICILIVIKFNNDYKYRTEVKDYLDTALEFSKYEEVVSNPELYMGGDIQAALEKINTKDKVVITLYNKKGITLYSTITDNEYMIPQEYLYQNLNEIQYGGTTYTLKKPVLDKEANIIGIYEISIARSKLRQSIYKGVLISMGIFAISMIILFTLVLRRINKRFNKPIRNVIQGMNDYAKGDNTVYVDYEAHDEIGELCKHFNAMKDEIEANKKVVKEEQKAKEYMIATISHDLKTPLTAIRAYAELIQLGEADEAKKETYLETILGKCDYMRDMLDDLLTYNLLSMNYQLNMVEVEGQEFCEMLFAGIDATCKDKQIKLETTIEVTGTYKVDVKYMTRVIDNIVSNSIRYVPEQGHIWLGAFSADQPFPDWLDETCKKRLLEYPRLGMFLVVQNEGKPINERDRENLFKPFYQGDEARNQKEHKGVGLGLSISKMIIEKHQGRIEVIPIKDVGNAMICFLRSTEYKET